MTTNIVDPDSKVMMSNPKLIKLENESNKLGRIQPLILPFLTWDFSGEVLIFLGYGPLNFSRALVSIQIGKLHVSKRKLITIKKV